MLKVVIRKKRSERGLRVHKKENKRSCEGRL